MEHRDRRKWEKKFAGAYSKNGEKFKEDLRVIIRANGGWPQGVDAIPWTKWAEYGDDLQKLFDPLVYNVFLTSARRLAKEAGVDFSWEMMNRRAANYANIYSYSLVKDITDKDRELLQKTVTQYYKEGMSLEEAVELIEESPAFGKARAELIAITEVTRTSVAGEYLQAEALRDQGWDLVPVWQTRYDEFVCPRCGPRHDIPRLDEWTPDGWTDPPPAHPRCRCWLNWVPRDQVPTGGPPQMPTWDEEKEKEKEEREPIPAGMWPTPDKMAEMGFRNYVKSMLPEATIKEGRSVVTDAFYEDMVAKELYEIRTSGKFEKCLPEMFRIGYKSDFPGMMQWDCPAWASRVGMKVSTNPLCDWSEATAKKLVDTGTWSQTSSIAHEFGHIGHYRMMIDHNFYVPNTTGVLNSLETRIAGEVSKYATYKGHAYEFVAETFSGLNAGKKYSKSVITLYKRYGGPEVPGVAEYTEKELRVLRDMWPSQETLIAGLIGGS